MIITGAFLFWGNESSTFHFDLWMVILLSGALIVSFFTGFNLKSFSIFTAFILIWANSSSVFFIALRCTQVSIIQLAIFFPLTSVIVGKYLDKKFSVIKHQWWYNILLMLIFIALGIGLGWITTFFPAFEWENAVVEFFSKRITPLVLQATKSVGTKATSFVGSMIVSPFTSLYSWIWAST